MNPARNKLQKQKQTIDFIPSHSPELETAIVRQDLLRL